MAKKHQRSGKPVAGGGRVTPKGVRPSGAASRADDEEQSPSIAPRPSLPTRSDPAHGNQPRGQAGPTRAGHHHGQR